jgi:hypothetical protein
MTMFPSRFDRNHPAAAFAVITALVAALVGALVASAPAQARQTSGTGNEGAAAAGVSRTFAGTDENFPNPGRGETVWNNPQASTNPSTTPLSQLADYLDRQREQAGSTTVRQVYAIGAWREQALPESFLDAVRADFKVAREHGYSVVPYFAYDWSPKGSTPDAPADRIVGHLQQLGPVLKENEDVLAFMISGFIGPWGEGWRSDFGNVTDEGKPNANTERIWRALLDAVPASRAVTLRTARSKQAVHGAAPLEAAEAFGGSDRARLGFNNECYMSADHNDESGPEKRKEFRPYFDAEGRYLPQLVAIDADCLAPGQTVTCPELMEELAATHVDTSATLPVDRQPELKGCLEQMRQRLGYRFRLTEATTPTTATRGEALSVTLKVANDGWAPPYQERPVELVLRRSTDGAVTRMSAAGSDPRTWQSDQTTTMTLRATVPADLAAGKYEVLVRLPDAAGSLRNDPRYAIRFANTDVWQPSTGDNSLGQTVEIQ